MNQNYEVTRINLYILYKLGIGYSQLSEFTAAMEIPCMSYTTYSRVHVTISFSVHNTAWDEMKKAGVEERELALETGEVDENEIAMCTVVADGQWCKRSYKTKYVALSGVVCKHFVILC